MGSFTLSDIFLIVYGKIDVAIWGVSSNVNCKMADLQKVVLVGNSQSGKTTVCYNLNKLDYDIIPPTMGVFVHFYTSPNGTKYAIWDCAGQKKWEGLGKGYYFGADIVIIFDGGKKYKTKQQREDEAREVSPKAKIYYAKGSLDKKEDKVRKILA